MAGAAGEKKTTQRKHDSGKKKRPTRKAVLIVERRRRIGYLSPSQRGARHDKRLCDPRQIVPCIPPEVSFLGDSAFQGLWHPGLCLPVKGSQKHPLTDEQRQWNTLLASSRVVVEHCIGGMKRYQAVAGIYRNRCPKTDDRFNRLAAGLWNFSLN